MCEFVVAISDKAPGRRGMYVTGDVIEVMDDGHPWTHAELTHPGWRIVKAPGVPKSFALGFLVPTSDMTGRPVHYRGQGFVLDGVVGEVLRRSSGQITLSRQMTLELFGLVAQRAAGEVV